MKGSEIYKLKTNDRIKAIRRSSKINLNQEEFGRRLGVTKTSISRLEKGERNLTSQMFTSICREFNVNEEWLKSGEGEMFVKLNRGALAARIVGNALTSDDEFVKNTFIALGELSPDEWKLIKKIVDKIKTE